MGWDYSVCILTRVVDTESDPHFDKSMTIMDTKQGLESKFNLPQMIADGWDVITGRKARDFFKRALTQEAIYQRQRTA